MQIGGPLMAIDRTDRRKVYSYLAGIISSGYPICGTAGIPSIYTVIF